MDQIETDDDNILAKESSSLSEEPPNKKHKLREYLRIIEDPSFCELLKKLDGDIKHYQMKL
ncbi:2603_t:CDS:2 [Funneliformis geosporum]|nr:2603_t:CDS:2 [Funneliformis geosporum]